MCVFKCKVKVMERGEKKKCREEKSGWERIGNKVCWQGRLIWKNLDFLVLLAGAPFLDKKFFLGFSSRGASE